MGDELDQIYRTQSAGKYVPPAEDLSEYVSKGNPLDMYFSKKVQNPRSQHSLHAQNLVTEASQSDDPNLILKESIKLIDKATRYVKLKGEREYLKEIRNAISELVN